VRKIGEHHEGITLDHSFPPWHLSLDRFLSHEHCDDVMDKELADKVVALGVGEYHIRAGSDKHYHVFVGGIGQSDEQFVRDWRVAGALMEKCVVEELELHLSNVRADTRVCNIDRFAPDESEQINDYVPVSIGRYERNLPRAIIEACVEALGE